MSNVVPFEKPKQEPLVWRCNCGCFTHLAYEDGGLECALCGAFVEIDGGTWRVNLGEPPAVPRETEASDIKVTNLDSPEMAIKNVLKKADPDMMEALIVIHSDGRVSCWGQDFDTNERAEWVNNRIDVARDLLVGKSEEALS